MKPSNYDLIVIGGGPAGVTAALRARELGATVALVERGLLGGTCTNDGCAPTRVLAKTARLLRDADNFDEFGLEGQAPTLNWPLLMARTHYVVNALHEKKQLLGHLEASGVETFLGVGTARFLNPNTISIEMQRAPADGHGDVSQLASESELRAERFILCVGGHARRLNFPGAELTVTHSDIWSLQDLPKRTVIVGGAATGCQLASVLRQFGAQVTLLEVAPRLLPVEDELTSEVMRREFSGRGIKVETGIAGIERVEQAADGLRAVYGKNNSEIALEADAVIAAVGWVGNTEDLGLDKAGVETQRGYVLVDDSLRTTAPNIFAAGDITGRMMLVQSGTQEGLIAAENAIQGGQQTFAHTIVPHGGFTDPEYGSVGLTEAQAHRQGKYVTATLTYAELDRAVIDNQLAGFCKLIVAPRTRRILGAHVVGEQALEVTQIVAAAMAADARIGDLAKLEIAYPTYASIVGLAARRIVRELGVEETRAGFGELGRVHDVEWERKAE